MAQLYAKGLLKQGEVFIHESIIGSQLIGQVESTATIGSGNNTITGIMPSIQGWAKVTGYNTIIVDSKCNPPVN